MVKHTIPLILAALLVTGCHKVDLTGLVAPASAEVNQRARESLDINAERGAIDIVSPTDDYRVYVCSDIHVENDHHRFSEFLRRQRSDSEARLGLLLGDISSQPGAMETAAGIMAYQPSRDVYNTPVMTIVGNHDLFFNQWEDYKRFFGSSTYAFTVTTPNYRDLYVMLDSGGGCHGKTQMEWLREVLQTRGQYRHCVVCSHVNVFRTDMSQFISGNLPLEETYELLDILANSNVELYLQGHDHHRKETLYGGVRYITLDSLKDSVSYVSYVRLDVADGLAWTFEDNI